MIKSFQKKIWLLLLASMLVSALLSSQVTAQGAQGICDRTPTIRDVLVSVTNQANCNAVTDAHLAAITSALNWQNAGYTTIVPNDFAGLTNIPGLSLSAHNIATIPANAFSSLTNLKTLSLRSNNIASIHANALASLSKLETLNLQNNLISSIPVGVFTPLSKLKKLDFYNNRLTSIPANAFASLKELEALNLRSNQIATIQADAFTNITATIINLSANSFTTLPLNLLATHTNPSGITDFNITGNSLTGGSWEITNVSWVEDSNNPGNFTLHIGHALPQNITIAITSSNGNLNATSIVITKGETASNKVTWSTSSANIQAIITATNPQINIAALSGHINIPTLDIAADFCRRTQVIRDLLLAALSSTDCTAVTVTALGTITGSLNWANQNINNMKSSDLNDVDMVTNINLANNNLTRLVNLTFNDVPAATLSFANNNISVIEVQALYFADNSRTDRDWDFSNNSITYDTLATGFLTNQFSVTPAINKFNFSRNLITNINQTTDSFFTDLTVDNLNLSHNQIENFPGNTFQNLVPHSSITVDLSNNSITALVPNAFNRSEWRNIYLSDNQISALQNNAFNNLGDIQTIDLSGNQLVDFNASAISLMDTTKITDLRLSNNPLVLKTKNFAGLSIVNLYLNELSTTTIPATAFYDISNLTTIEISNGNIAMLAANAFTNATGLNELNLTNNSLTTIPADAFGNGTNLAKLYLNNNQIATIEAAAFALLNALDMLGLSDNSLTTLLPSSFENLTATDIDLSNNAITTLPINFLATHADPSSITNFDVSGNPLTGGSWEITNVSWMEDANNANQYTLNIGHALPADITIAITSSNGGLDTSSLTITKGNTVSNAVSWTATNAGDEIIIKPTSSNINITALQGHINIPELGGDICNRPMQIQTLLLAALSSTDCSAVTADDLATITQLDWANQDIMSLAADDLAGLLGVTKLSLFNNSLTTLPSDVFTSLANLAELNLGNNSLTTLPSDVFTSLANLAELNLGNNSLTTLPADVFTSLANLAELNLENNSLTTLPSDVFTSLANLAELNLGNNSLTILPSDVFTSLTNLAELNLGNNSLTTLPSDVFTSLANLAELNLGNNSLTTLPANTFSQTSNVLVRLNLDNNLLTSIHANAFNRLSATNISLNSNSLTTLPINLLANHTQPSEITTFTITGNSLTDNTWEITNVSWMEDANNANQYMLNIGHALPADITIAITSSNGMLNVSSLTITKGDTVSNSVTWTGTQSDADVYIVPTTAQITLPSLSGYITIPTLAKGGICDRSPAVIALLLTLTVADNCAAVAPSQLITLMGDFNLHNVDLSSLLAHDLDNLTTITSFTLTNNTLTNLVNNTLNQTAPASVDFANNDLATISRLALFTSNAGADDIDVNLSRNAITAATLGSGFLTANGAQQFVGGEFDLSFNQIDALVDTYFTGFNPTVLRLNDNDIASIADSSFTASSGTTELYLSNNQLISIATATFAGLSSLTTLDLGNNTIATITNAAFSALTALTNLSLADNDLSTVTGAIFTDLTATDIDLSDNSIATLPVNFLATHADPSSITNFDLTGNSLTDNTWEITNVSWMEDSNNANQYMLNIGHALPADITIAITSSNGDLNVSSLTITKGSTASDPVSWTGATASDTKAKIEPATDRVNVPILNGHVMIGIIAGAPQFTTTVDTQTVVVNNTFTAIKLPSAIGGDGALTYALIEANSTNSGLPAGLVFTAATREMTGLINTTGNYNLTYIASDEDSDSTNQSFILEVVANQAPVFPTDYNATQPAFVAGEPISITLPEASAGNGATTYSLNDTLPAGLVFNATDRTIMGNPTESGTFKYMFIATDALDNEMISLGITFTVEAQTAPQFADILDNTTVRENTTVNITVPSATGGNGNLTYSIQGLPTGLSFVRGTGTDNNTIEGTPSQNGQFNITVTVADADLTIDNDSANLTFVLTVVAELTFAPALPANYYATPEVPFTHTLPEATGGVLNENSNYTYALNVDDLPTGILFNADSRILSGSTSEIGSYNLTYTVTDSESETFSANTTLVVDAVDAEFASQFPDTEIQLGQSVKMTLPALTSDGQLGITYSTSGLPNGLTFNDSSLELTGNATQLGKFTVLYEAEDQYEQSANQSFVITVKANTALIQDILWRQALAIADQTVNSVKKRFNLVDQNRLPYTQSENYQGANFQVTETNWLGLWTNIGSSSLENSENGYSWDGDTDSIQFGVDFSGKDYLVGVMSETVSTSASFAVAADTRYTGNLDINDLSLFSIYGGYYQDKYNVWAITSSGSGTAELSIAGNNGKASSGVDYSMTAIGGSYKITDLLDVGFEGITSASLDLANNAISNITSNSASRNKVFGSIDFGRWTQKPNNQSDFSWKPTAEFALRSDSGDGGGSSSGLELTAAVELEYKIVNFEFGLRTFSADNYSETGQWFTFHLIPNADTGLNVELTQRLGDTESVSDNLLNNNAEVNGVVAGLSQNNALNSIGKISYGWARDKGTYRLFTQGESQINNAQTDALFGDVSAMFDADTGIVWDSIGISFDSADSKYTWSTDIQGGFMSKYINHNIDISQEPTAVSFSGKIRF